MEGGENYQAPKFIIRRKQQEDEEEHEEAVIVPTLVDQIVPQEKKKRTVKRYVDRIFAAEIAAGRGARL